MNRLYNTRLVLYDELKGIIGNNFPIMTKKEKIININKNNEISKNISDFDDDDEISFFYNNKTKNLEYIWILSLNKIINEISIYRDKFKNNELLENTSKNTFSKNKFPINIGTEFFKFKDLHEFLLLNKLSDNSPIKNISINMLSDLNKNKKNYKDFRLFFCFEKVDNKKKLVGELMGSNIIQKKVHKNVYLRKNYSFKRINYEEGVTIYDNEDICISSPFNYNEVKPKKINSKKKFKISKKNSNEFKEEEFIEKNKSNTYVPMHKRGVKMRNDKLELYINGYPNHCTENDIVNCLENYLFNVFNENNRFIKSIFLKKKKLFNGILNCFCFVKFYDMKYAKSVIEGSQGRDIIIDSAIIHANWKE